MLNGLIRMGENLPVPERQQVLSAELVETIEAAKRFEELARASNTRRAYNSDWLDFAAYCERHGFQVMPASDRTVELYISYLAFARKPKTLNPSTIARRLAAIAAMHEDSGFESPTGMLVVRNAWKGIRRALRVKPKPKRAIEVEVLQRLLAPIGRERPIDIRDRAILLLGFSAALRRSEIVALQACDVEFDGKGMVVTIAYSKTNQEGEPERVGVRRGSDLETCPVAALEEWLSISGIKRGALFRAVDRHGNIQSRQMIGASIAEVVKRATQAAGLDASLVAAHSLRSGHVTTRRRRGDPDYQIRGTTRHKTSTMLDRYTHAQTLWDAASENLGL